MSLIDQLPKVRGVYRENAKIQNWFDVGGNAQILFRPADIDDLCYFLKNRPKDLPITVLGAASNVIIKDSGVAGVVIKFGAEFAQVKQIDETTISAGAGCLCANVALQSKELAIGGMEFFSGIPGAIGGAIAMNAGCYGSEIANILVATTAIDYDGNIVELTNAECAFAYRKNSLAGKYIFVAAQLRGVKSTSAAIAQNILQLKQQREQAQPIRAKTGGSTFKNPKDTDKKAWQLIDEAGCRGLMVGDAQMSEKHCNFMINTNKANAQDLIDLANLVRSKVKEKSAIDLELEIKIIG